MGTGISLESYCSGIFNKTISPINMIYLDDNYYIVLYMT